MNALAARSHFDPARPTSLLYKKTADGGYRLVGVMYTDRVDASLEEIDARIPLRVGISTSISAGRPSAIRPSISVRTPSTGSSDRSTRKRPARRRVAPSIP